LISQARAGSAAITSRPTIPREASVSGIVRTRTSASRTVSTNDFGSASGEFVVPAGRILGGWRVESSLGPAFAFVRVEEYKRPTFEVTIQDPREPLRLNRPAALLGEARYYFGLPVSSGTARWRVARKSRL